MKESAIEARLVREVKKRGGLCYKFTSPGNPGVPDRIVILPGGTTVYVELKTEIGRLAKVQKWQIEELRRRGAVVQGCPASGRVSRNTARDAARSCIGLRLKGKEAVLFAVGSAI